MGGTAEAARNAGSCEGQQVENAPGESLFKNQETITIGLQRWIAPKENYAVSELNLRKQIDNMILMHTKTNNMNITKISDVLKMNHLGNLFQTLAQ